MIIIQMIEMYIFLLISAAVLSSELKKVHQLISYILILFSNRVF